jgi:hypothetical protein
MVKKLLLIVMMLLVVPFTVLAADTTKTLKFAWDYDASQLAQISGWGLYMRAISGGPAEQTIGVQKGSTLTTSQTFTVSGTPGQTVRKFFVMDAVSIENERSGYSNEVYVDFKIPMSAPFNLTVEVIIVPTLK